MTGFDSLTAVNLSPPLFHFLFIHFRCLRTDSEAERTVLACFEFLTCAADYDNISLFPVHVLI